MIIKTYKNSSISQKSNLNLKKQLKNLKNKQTTQHNLPLNQKQNKYLTLNYNTKKITKDKIT